MSRTRRNPDELEGYRPPVRSRWEWRLGGAALYRRDGVLLDEVVIDGAPRVRVSLPAASNVPAELRRTYGSLEEAREALDRLFPAAGEDLVPLEVPEGWEERNGRLWTRRDGAGLVKPLEGGWWRALAPPRGDPTYHSYPTLAQGLREIGRVYPSLCFAAHPEIEGCRCELLPDHEGDHFRMREIPGGTEAVVWVFCDGAIGKGRCRRQRGHPGDCDEDPRAAENGNLPLSLRGWARMQEERAAPNEAPSTPKRRHRRRKVGDRTDVKR